MGFRVWGLGFRVQGLRFRVWALGLRGAAAWRRMGLGLRVEGQSEGFWLFSFLFGGAQTLPVSEPHTKRKKSAAIWKFGTLGAGG